MPFRVSKVDRLPAISKVRLLAQTVGLNRGAVRDIARPPAKDTGRGLLRSVATSFGGNLDLKCDGEAQIDGRNDAWVGYSTGRVLLLQFSNSQR